VSAKVQSASTGTTSVVTNINGTGNQTVSSAQQQLNDAIAKTQSASTPQERQIAIAEQQIAYNNLSQLATNGNPSATGVSATAYSSTTASINPTTGVTTLTTPLMNGTNVGTTNATQASINNVGIGIQSSDATQLISGTTNSPGGLYSIQIGPGDLEGKQSNIPTSQTITGYVYTPPKEEASNEPVDDTPVAPTPEGNPEVPNQTEDDDENNSQSATPVDNTTQSDGTLDEERIYNEHQNSKRSSLASNILW
jgi:hypothetical protein